MQDVGAALAEGVDNEYKAGLLCTSFSLFEV